MEGLYLISKYTSIDPTWKGTLPPSIGSGRCRIIIWSSVTPVPRQEDCVFFGEIPEVVVMLPSPEDSKNLGRSDNWAILVNSPTLQVKIVFKHQATESFSPNSGLCLQRWIATTTSQDQRYSSFWFGGTAMGMFHIFLYLFEGSFRDGNPQKRCWSHSAQRPFLAVGFGSR